jgi:hypothetical protein
LFSAPPKPDSSLEIGLVLAVCVHNRPLFFGGGFLVARFRHCVSLSFVQKCQSLEEASRENKPLRGIHKT